MKLIPDWLNWPQTQKLVKAYANNADKLRFVGGAVRDSLLSIEVHDVDAASILTPEKNIELLKQAGIRTIPTGLKHGTITAAIDGKNFEITTLRRDTSCDGRHAEVEFTTDWQQDAGRRDFTMNALYMATDGQIFDYFGGIDDAKNGKVIFIGDVRSRIQEDYLRILRFFRFHAFYASQAPDQETLNACNEFAPQVKTISGERIQHEMLKFLSSPHAFATLALMPTPLLKQIFAGTEINIPTAKNSGNTACNLAFLLLSSPDSKEALEAISSRWHISNNLKKHLQLLLDNINFITSNLPLPAQKHLIRKLTPEVFSELLSLKQMLNPEENYAEMQSLSSNWQIPTFPVTGSDLLKLGLPAGKEIGDKLQELESKWEESDYKLSKEQLLISSP